MSLRIPIALALALSVGGAASPSHAELQKWDAAKVGALANQLRTATQELYDTFYKQPKVGAGQSRPYYRLKQDVRHLRSEAKALAGALEKGASQDETMPIYDDLMQVVRRARQNAREVFTTQDVEQKASAVRTLLNQLAPYYDPDAVPLQPLPR